MMGSYTVLVLFAFLVEGVFGDEVMEGDLVTLNTDDIKNHDDIVRWYFNGTRIALINGHPNTSCLYDGKGGRFRGRLEVDYKTGSLIITNIRSEHAGRYEAEIIRGNSTGKSVPLKRNGKCDGTKIITKSSIPGETIKSFSLTVSAVPGSGLPPAAVAGIVGVLLLVAAAVVGVINYRHRRYRNDMKKVPEQESKDEKQNDERHMI